MPEIERPDWQERAACRGMGPAFFFPTTGTNNKAPEICDTCPVRWECFDYAVKHNMVYGIWGGVTEKRRLEMTRYSA
jgi:WhiB family transcriptional regulator, redox-sensing transcriptional regulator